MWKTLAASPVVFKTITKQKNKAGKSGSLGKKLGLKSQQGGRVLPPALYCPQEGYLRRVRLHAPWAFLPTSLSSERSLSTPSPRKRPPSPMKGFSTQVFPGPGLPKGQLAQRLFLPTSLLSWWLGTLPSLVVASPSSEGHQTQAL